MLTDRANIVLDAWSSRLASEEDVRAWADKELMAFADPGDIPTWLLDLVTYGPQHVTDQGLSWRSVPTSRANFAFHALRVDLSDRSHVERFARWLAGAAMGEDLALPEVELGYIVDHHLCDLGDVDGAIARVRQDLPSLLRSCRAAVAALFREPD